MKKDNHTLEITSNGETFSVRNSTGFQAKDIPMVRLHMLASAYCGFDEKLKLLVNSESLRERFIQLIHRYNTPEHLKVPRPLSNYLANSLDKDRFDFTINKNKARNHSCIFLGAGPTLKRDIDQAFESGHCVIAAGSAITFCAKHGYTPDICLALDPNDTEIIRFENLPDSWKGVPLVYKGRLIPEALALWPGKRVWVPGTGWQGTSIWEGTTEKFSGGGIGVSTWVLEIAKFLNFDSIYFVGVDLGLTKEGGLYDKSMAHLEKREDITRREKSFQDEKITLSELIKKLELTVHTLSTELGGVARINEIPRASKKFTLTLQPFTRKYKRRVRRIAKDILQSIDVVLSGRSFTLPELESQAVVKYLLQPQIHIAMNKFRVLGTLDLNIFMDTCKTIKPYIQKIANG